MEPQHCAGRRRLPFRGGFSPPDRSDRRRRPTIAGLPFGDVALELDVVRETERQQFALERTSAGVCLPQTQKPPSPSSISPAFKARLAVATTSERNPFGAPVGSLRSARLDGNAELEPDHVDRPVKRGVSAGLIRQHRVFLKAAARISVSPSNTT